MGANWGRLEQPVKAIGIAAIAILILVRGADLLGNRKGGPPPRTFAEVREFRLVRAHATSANYYEPGALPQPSIQYEIEVPAKLYMEHLEARLVGEGKPLSVEAGGRGPATWIFSRVGYPHAPRSPRLELVNRGKVVWETKVPEVPPPTRQVPLVVPLDEEMRFRPLSKEEASSLRGLPGPRDYAVLEGYSRTSDEGPPWVGKMEWPAVDLRFWRMGRVPGSQDVGFVYTLDRRNPSGFVETYSPTYRNEEQTREIEIDIEISADKVTVLRPVFTQFGDQASVEIPARARPLAKDRQGKPRPFLGLPFVFTAGFMGGLAGGNRGVGLSLMMPMWPTEARPARDDGSNANRKRMDSSGNLLELVSPSLEELGVTRLQLGIYEMTSNTTRPLAIGRHRLKFRMTHTMRSNLIRRRYVRIE